MKTQKSQKNTAADILIYAVLAIASLITVMPLVRMLIGSFRTGSGSFGFDNYVGIWNNVNVLSYSLNSIIYSSAGVGAMVLCGSLAAFSLEKYPIKSKKRLQLLLLMGQMTPAVALLVPFFYYLKMLHLVNTRIGIILVYIALGLPFTVFLLKGFFRDFPDDLLDSARIAGCSEPAIFFRIVLPVSKTGLSVVIIFQSVWLWNEFIVALVLLFKEQLKSLNIGIYSTMGQYSTDYPMLFAGLILASLPVIILFGFFQKQFIGGLTGSLKG